MGGVAFANEIGLALAPAFGIYSVPAYAVIAFAAGTAYHFGLSGYVERGVENVTRWLWSLIND